MKKMICKSMIAQILVIAFLVLNASIAFGAEEVVYLPASLKIIEEEAFYGTDMEKVVVPDGTTEIHSRAFADSALKEIVIPTSVTYIADDAFEGCESINIIYKNPVSEFAYKEYNDHVRITKYLGTSPVVFVPSMINGKPVTHVKLGFGISESTSGKFTDVVKVVLPDSIIKLDDYAFGGYDKLHTVVGLEYVRELGDNCFESCYNLQTAHFSKNLKKIGSYPFTNAYLRYVTLPDDLPYEWGSPYRLRAVEELTLIRGDNEPTIKLVDGVIFTADGKTLINVLPLNHKNYYVVPDGTETITMLAFDWAIFADGIEIPASVQNIQGIENYLDGRSVYVYRDSYAHEYLTQNPITNGTLYVIDDGVNDLQGLVDEIIAEVITDDMSDYEKALTLHDWIIDNGSYDYTYENSEAIHILSGGSGVCDAYARAYCVLLDAVGIENRRETCYVNGTGHAITAVKLNGEWCYVDCTNDDEGFGHPDYLFGFNDDIYNVYYAGALSVSAPSISNYAPLVDGRLDKAVKSLSQLIQTELEAGSTVFVVSLDSDLWPGDIASYALAAVMTDKSWVVDGKSIKITCEASADGFVCYAEEEEWVYDEATGGVCIITYNGSDAAVTIPEEIDGQTVVALRGAFNGNENIVSVVIPDTVTDIGDETFAGCTALETVYIPEGLKNIGTGAFWGCTMLSSDIILPGSLQSIGDSAFAGCISLKRVDIPDGNIALGDCLFAECSNLSSVSFGEGITVITDSMFYDCISLKTLTLPNSITKIEASAFVRSGITQLHLPKNVSEVHWDAFVSANKLTSLTVDSGNPYFAASGNMLFSKDMKKIVVTTCGVDKDLTIPNGVQEIGAKAFKMNNSVVSITLPASVKTIGEEAFMGANNLWTLNMGNGVTSIGTYAFAAGYTYSGMPENGLYSVGTDGRYSVGNYCSTAGLRIVHLSAGLNTIGKYAFIGQGYVDKLFLPDSLTTVNVWFIDHAVKLYVPESMTYMAEQEMKKSSDVLTICGISGSYAETYAKTYGCNFVDQSQSITLNYNEVDLVPQESVTLQVIAVNGATENVDPSDVTWTSSNPDCVKVENGILTTVGIGTVTVTAEYQGATAVCKVISWAYQDDNITWWTSNIDGSHDITVDEEVSMRLTYVLVSTDENGNEIIDPIEVDYGDDDHATYSVSDPSVLYVTEYGNVTAVGRGTADVIATLPDGRTFKYEWTVQ